MTIQDQVIGSLCAWREARGGLGPGMTSILNVLMNRAAKRGTNVYTEATRKLQFSSMTTKGDPQLTNFPAAMDPQWQQALALASLADDGQLEDTTGGATVYYNPHGLTPAEIEGTFTLPDGTTIPWVKGWDRAAVRYTVTIANQYFFLEI